MDDAAEREQLTPILALVRETLGQNVLGVYLYGSAVDGGLRPDSDVDVLVVLRRPSTHDEKAALADRLRPVSRRSIRPASWHPVELTMVVQTDVRPWRYPPARDFQYGEWLAEAFDRGEVDPSEPTDPDLAVLITTVLLHGLPLLGPPPAALLDPVPRADLVRSMVHGIEGLLADLDTDTRNIILTLARIWTTLATGEIRSKDAAADWVLPRLPETHRPVLVHARAIYLGEREERWDGLESAVRPHADHVIGEIRRLAAEPVP